MNQEDAFAQCQQFWQGRRGIVLSTQNQEGVLLSSHAPFVYDEAGRLAVFVSALAAHTQNLHEACKTATPMGGLLLQDEQDCTQIFARERLSLVLLPREVSRDSAEFIAWMSRFERRFGDIIATLQTLPDFVLFELQVQKAVYVRGFAQAYEFVGGLNVQPQWQKPR
ncbi:heme utilization protein HutZ [Thiosulfatimonas sediminis]|uniref:Heme utilization protein HutZ n=1 Tax=Thiosulfatimonas sediminis TaxID=2675054 RepID=A0A6F8PXK8_9GAMM|nr:hypothetical protein [Thiosulfatimonas sediminis]BBP46777.1 heme utilization protein HutZ [Thiosulfatimonas sediminis]